MYERPFPRAPSGYMWIDAISRRGEEPHRELPLLRAGKICQEAGSKAPSLFFLSLTFSLGTEAETKSTQPDDA